MPETVFHAASGGAVAGDARPDLIVGALAALKSIGPGAEAALPAIAPLLTNPNANIRIMAAAALLRIGGAKEAEATGVLVDGLENRLRGSQSFLLPIKFEELPADGAGWATRGAAAAAILLGEAGPAARASIPHLESRLHSSNFELQIFAAQAIWRISADATKALPVMIAVLDSIPAPNPQGVSGASQDYRLVKTIEIIGQMGPAARNALPSLERVRAFSPAAARAVKRAIARIEAGGPPPLTPNTR